MKLCGSESPDEPPGTGNGKTRKVSLLAGGPSHQSNARLGVRAMTRRHGGKLFGQR